MKTIVIVMLALLAVLPKAAAQNAIVVSPAELAAAYEANAISADVLYKNKYIEVTGKITKLGRVDASAFGRAPYVTIDGVVTKYFPKSKEALISKLQMGQDVTLTGICLGNASKTQIDGAVTLRDR